MNISLPRVRRLALVALGVAIAALLVATFYANRDSASANHTPANKVWADGNTLEIMRDQVNAGGAGAVIKEENHKVLEVAKARFNNTTDLRISVAAECALWTNTATFGDDDAESKARVEIWVEIDGNVVPVAPDDTDAPTTTVDPDDPAGAGRAVFCNRATRMKTENIEQTTVGENAPGGSGPLAPDADADPLADGDEEDDIVIRSYNRSREASAFNWGAMNIGVNYDEAYNGKGIVEIKVHARLATSIADEDDQDSTGQVMAMAGVGKRTLFVEPVKMANDAGL
ncbi:MAG TPA: hypothetical protein VNB64_10620 [Solirubrobacteraceae bacterium]|nr:hypothetical protein [Solirubrobacteraceae bacterium]